MPIIRFGLFLIVVFALYSCQSDQMEESIVKDDESQGSNFIFGADLSYLNQILDYGGTYKVNGQVQNPYEIFSEAGTGLARFRLWHNPVWTSEIYGGFDNPLYNDLLDVERSISSAKTNGMEILLNFHYSDIWADPGRQEIPKAWAQIQDMETLRDSVYQYTFSTLKYLESKGLLPEYVQIGNETNCGMMYSNAPASFPNLNVCEGNWSNFRAVVASAIEAVNDAAGANKIKIMLHVADPTNIEWWFDNFTSVSDSPAFDIIGFSYYPLWHTDIPLNSLSSTVSKFRSKFSKELIMLETAYPWTTEGNDEYNNLFGGQNPIRGFPFTKQGQYDLLKHMSQALMDGGAMGIVYWEPGWISSEIKDLWGQGSSWENCTYFDFDSNLHMGASYMTETYNP